MIRRPSYYNEVCQYLEDLTPFMLYDESDNQKIIYIPKHLAAVDSAGAKIKFDGKDAFTTSLEIHMSVFDKVKPLPHEMIAAVENKMIEG